MSQRKPSVVSTGAFENRCMTRTSGSPEFHRNKDTRQLCAPKSTATRAFCFALDSINRLFVSASTTQNEQYNYLKNASVNPPSTGIRCPVVQRDCGPARNRIAAAQSCGSIG